jgi:hypothetical protein
MKQHEKVSHPLHHPRKAHQEGQKTGLEVEISSLAMKGIKLEPRDHRKELPQPEPIPLAKFPSQISLGSTPTLVPEADQEKLTKFLSGFSRFRKTYFAYDNKLFDSLKESQSPKILVIGCCDSRVDPAIITDCDPGDLFVVRNGITCSLVYFFSLLT